MGRSCGHPSQPPFSHAPSIPLGWFFVHRIEWFGQTLELLPQRALYWFDRRTLIITDPHFGKGATFRSRGIPVPSGSTNSDLIRLSTLLSFFQPEELLILGDFFHTAESQSEEVLEALYFWRQQFARLRITLIPGNHDKHAGHPPEYLDVRIVQEPYWMDPFHFCHHPICVPQDSKHYIMADHVHPAIKLRDPSGTELKASCFCFGPDVALLPAFGSFTGTCTIIPSPQDRVFLIGPSEVMEIPARLVSLGR